jgi:hypothetical protein
LIDTQNLASQVQLLSQFNEDTSNPMWARSPCHLSRNRSESLKNQRIRPICSIRHLFYRTNGISCFWWILT